MNLLRGGYPLRGRDYTSLTGSTPFQPNASETQVTDGAGQTIVTTAAFKNFVPVNNSADDPLCDQILQAVTEQIERFIRLDLAPKERRAFWRWPGNELVLPYGPHGDILEVVAIRADNTETVLVEDEDYHVHGDSLKWLFILCRHDARYFRVRFQSGYAQCPRSAYMAIIEQGAAIYKNRQNPDLPVRMTKEGFCVEAYSLLMTLQKGAS